MQQDANANSAAPRISAVRGRSVKLSPTANCGASGSFHQPLRSVRCDSCTEGSRWPILCVVKSASRHTQCPHRLVSTRRTSARARISAEVDQSVDNRKGTVSSRHRRNRRASIGLALLSVLRKASRSRTRTPPPGATAGGATSTRSKSVRWRSCVATLRRVAGDEKHPIRNGIIIAVGSAAILYAATFIPVSRFGSATSSEGSGSRWRRR